MLHENKVKNYNFMSKSYCAASLIRPPVPIKHKEVVKPLILHMSSL